MKGGKSQPHQLKPTYGAVQIMKEDWTIERDVLQFCGQRERSSKEVDGAFCAGVPISIQPSLSMNGQVVYIAS